MRNGQVKATPEDRQNARQEKFLIASLASLEVDDEAPIDDFERACAADPELQGLKAEFKAFLLGSYLGAQARKGAFMREINSRENEIKVGLGTAALDSIPDEVDYGPEKSQPGALSQTPTLKELIQD